MHLVIVRTVVIDCIWTLSLSSIWSIDSASWSSRGKGLGYVEISKIFTSSQYLFTVRFLKLMLSPLLYTEAKINIFIVRLNWKKGHNCNLTSIQQIHGSKFQLGFCSSCPYDQGFVNRSDDSAVLKLGHWINSEQYIRSSQDC